MLGLSCKYSGSAVVWVLKLKLFLWNVIIRYSILLLFTYPAMLTSITFKIKIY